MTPTQPDLFTYPNSPGWKARATSERAAEEVAPRAPTLRDRALETIKTCGGNTADEVALWLGESVLAIRPRITELALAGNIKDSGRRRKNQSGKSAIVWVAA